MGIVDCGLRNPVAAKFIDEEKDISPRFSLRQHVFMSPFAKVFPRHRFTLYGMHCVHVNILMYVHICLYVHVYIRSYWDFKPDIAHYYSVT